MGKQLLRRLASSRDGSVILETALMIMILLLLAFGIIDMGRALFTENNLVSAAREGARFGAVDQSMPTDAAGIRAVVKAHFSAFGGPALTDANIDVTPEPVGGPYTSIRVRINYPYSWITPLPSLLGGALPNTFHAQAEYNWESQ